MGSYYIKPNQPQGGGGDHVCNCGFMVSAQHRGKGVGRTMCEQSLAAAKALGFRAMQFNFVLASNTGAVRLWRRLGFWIVGTMPRAFYHPTLKAYVDAHVLYRDLV
jgi:ribosomal protein S18 acetylase RimI-like enzyme